MAEFDLAGAGGGISSPFGSQGGLTDTAGPTKFREVIKSIGPAIKGLGQAFATMAATGEVSLKKVEARLDSILKKLNTVNAAMAGTGSGGNVATQALNSSAIGGTSGANMPGWGGGIGSDPGGWGSNGGMGFPGMGAGAYFTAQEMGIPTFGQVAAGGGANGGITSGGAGSAASGSNPAFGGYGRPSAGMAAAGLAIAGVGAAGRMGQSMAQQGMSSYQLAFNVSSATGGGLSIAQAAKYANSKLFTGTTGYADTNAAIQTLQGAAGVGVNSKMFNQMARANSALTQFGQSAGVEGASLSDSAQYQAWLLSQQSVGVRGSLGLLRQPNAALNAFTVASKALSMTNPNLTAAQIGASGQGTPLYAKLLQDSGGDAATAQEMRLYLERQAQVRQKTGKTYNLGGANETASQTAAAQKALGLGQGNPIVQQNIATQQKSQALADASIGAAQAVTKAAEVTATALNNLAQSISPGMQNLIGRGAGGAGILGGGIEKGLGLGLGALEISRILKLGSSAGGILGSGARAAATGTSIGSATGALSTTEAAGGAAGAGGLLSALGPIAAVFGGLLGTRALGQYSKTNNGILGKIAGGIADNPLNPLRAASGIDPLTHIAGGLFKSMFGGGAASTSGGGAPTSNLGSGKVSTSPTTTGASIVRDAEKFLGVPYVWGGTTPNGFDCSGFTQYVYGQMGIKIPRTSEQQAQAGLKVPSLASAQQGDLVFYGGNGYDGSPSSPGHVGLYIGNGKMIDAPYPGTNVRVDNVGNPVAIRRYSKGGAGSAVQVGGGGPSSASLLNVKLGSIGGGNTGGGGFGFQLGEGSTGSESASLTAGLTPTMQNGGTTGGGTLGTKNAASSSGSAAASGTGITVGGNVKSWISQAEKITGVSSSWTVGLEEIIQHESSGNPSIINTWDSNAAAGHPSQGLMQLIPSNFKAYAKAPWNKNILDPVSNIVAGIGYIKGKYGSINNVPGVKALSAGQGYVGYEKGSMFIENDDLVKVHKGEMIIRAGAAGAMRMNQLSGPEGGVPGGTKVNFAKGAIAITWTTSSLSSAGISPTSVDTDALADTLQKSIQKKLSIKKISSE